MPMPVSEILKRMRQLSALFSVISILTNTPPSWVNFKALLMRFNKICVNLTASPLSMRGIASSDSERRYKFLFFAFTFIIVISESRSSRRLNGSNSMCIIPDSMRDKSSMSLMMVSKFSEDERMDLTYSCWFLSRLVFCKSPVKPRIAFIGVLISWLMFATNCSCTLELSFNFFSDLSSMWINFCCLCPW